MTLKYIDAHTHINFPEFEADREEVIKRAAEAGVGMINVGTDLETSRQVVWLAERYPNLWAIVGVHPSAIAYGRGPNDNEKLPTAEEWQELKTLAQNPKTVAIGECGLDYFRSTEETKPAQRELFQKQIELAHEAGKPLMLHVRNAYEDVISILKSNQNLLLPNRAGDVHFFAGDWAVAKQFLDLGFTLSFTGVLTFAHDYDEVIKNTPLDRLLIETDAPYAAPVPYRGKRNEPSYIGLVAARIAEIKGLPEPEVAAALLANTAKIFNLSL